MKTKKLNYMVEVKQKPLNRKKRNDQLDISTEYCLSQIGVSEDAKGKNKQPKYRENGRHTKPIPPK